MIREGQADELTFLINEIKTVGNLIGVSEPHADMGRPGETPHQSGNTGKARWVDPGSKTQPG